MAVQLGVGVIVHRRDGKEAHVGIPARWNTSAEDAWIRRTIDVNEAAELRSRQCVSRQLVCFSSFGSRAAHTAARPSASSFSTSVAPILWSCESSASRAGKRGRWTATRRPCTVVHRTEAICSGDQRDRHHEHRGRDAPQSPVGISKPVDLEIVDGPRGDGSAVDGSQGDGSGWFLLFHCGVQSKRNSSFRFSRWGLSSF